MNNNFVCPINLTLVVNKCNNTTCGLKILMASQCCISPFEELWVRFPRISKYWIGLVFPKLIWFIQLVVAYCGDTTNNSQTWFTKSTTKKCTTYNLTYPHHLTANWSYLIAILSTAIIRCLPNACSITGHQGHTMIPRSPLVAGI